MSRGWPIPAALAALSAAGLVAGLIGDGPWDLVASLSLLLPLGAAWWAGRRRG
ncbi:hypothetical protein [Dankookia rubra]|uniref:hypothetical protein n=1 Tax=Dankookia rubra TaxID=1442381 RepID=UPI001407F923|nr:hypothetical protein [Dankookia rubra]